MTKHILIAGGGIGGMISALYLKKRDMMLRLSKKRATWRKTCFCK